ncbi:MAG: hypothetical protein D6768_01800, partial [Chloroflexi bacterium]
RLAGAGAGASVLGYRFFGVDAARTQGWWLYAASIGLFAGGAILMTPGLPLRAELRRLVPNRNIGYGLLLIFTLALFLRLFNFGQQPFGIWFDEAEAGLQARQILQVDTYRPLFYPPINVTGQLLFLYALALRWLGDSIYSMRLVSVLFGLGGVLAAYLFGRELRGPRFGLALAFFLAMARWHVNFSRIAMTGVDAPFFEFLSLYLLTRLLKRGSLRDALWAGLSLGAGLLFYTAFRLFGLAMLIFAVIAVLRWWNPVLAALRGGGWRRVLGAALLLALSGWLVAMPLIHFARNNPDAFWYRTRQISILTKRDQADLTTALWESTRKHLLMFNVAGDRNGRHNLPGEPMLDPLMGVLLILGIALALARTRHPANLFFLILLPVALLGGILSVDFEAPQSLRSIAVLPAVVYFCALAAAALGREAEQSLAPLPRAVALAPAVLAGAVIFYSNAATYFIQQANDFASWNAFSAPETITGRQMAQLGPGFEYYLSPFLTNHPSIRFLAPEITNQHVITLPDALPIRDPSGKPVALFIHPDDEAIFTEARQFYPNAQFEVLRGPAAAEQNEGPPSVYFIALQPTDLQAVRGLDLRYLPQLDPNADTSTGLLLPPIPTSRALTVNATLPADSPTGGPYQAEWRGILYVPQYGEYRLRLETPGEGKLEIDGNPVLTGSGQTAAEMALAQGNHTIRVLADGQPGSVVLYWQPPGRPEEIVPEWALYSRPVTNHGLLGKFYANNNWDGPPALERIDPYLDTYFHLIPLQRPYTAEWSGSLVAPQSGVYQLGLRAVQEADLSIDGQPLLRTTLPNNLTQAPVTLTAGRHTIQIRFRDTVDRSRIHLMWVPPGGGFSAIPKEYLWPPMGSYPEPPSAPQGQAEMGSLALAHTATLGQPGSAPGQLREPRDVAVLTNGNLVVADTGNRRVQIFTPAKKFVTEISGGDEPFQEPLAVDILRQDSGDEILVLDSTLQWVYRFDEAGGYLGKFGGPAARLFHPRGMTVFDVHTVGVADTGTSRLVLFNDRGEITGAIGNTPGDGPGQFNEPVDAVRDVFGSYFVTEAENNRLQRLDAGGNWLDQWAIPPSFAFNGPHLALLPDSSLLVTDAQGQSVLRYSPDGVLLEQWHTVGPIELAAPLGIYFDPTTSRLYITDIGTAQVYVFDVEIK